MPETGPENESALWEQQLYQYAAELQELYKLEQQERQALAEEKLVLQYRVRELNSLNQLFQVQLERVAEMTELLRDLDSRLNAALGSATWDEAQARLKPLREHVRELLNKPSS